MRIVQAGLEDAQDILDLQKAAFQSEALLYDDPGISPLHATLPDIQKDLREKTVLKAVEDGRIVGSVRGRQEGPTCHIGSLIVRPDRQDKGIGTQLMREIEALFPRAARYEIFTGERNDKNLHLYAKLGYLPIPGTRLDHQVRLVTLEKRALHPE